MHECLTIPFMSEFSGCLVENPTCQFAVRFGFSFHCEHPFHQDFQTSDDRSIDHADLQQRYRDLREARRRAYLEQIRKSPKGC